MRCPPFCSLLLSFQLAGAVQTEPMILTLWLLAPETSPERLPSEFMPTRTIDRPMASLPLVPKRLSQLNDPPPRAVFSPNPSIVCSVLSSCTVTPLGVPPPDPVEPPPDEP